MNEKINKIINLSVESINEDLNLNLSNLDDTEISGGNSPLDSLVFHSSWNLKKT